MYAQRNLAYLYLHGIDGTPDLAEAAKWFKKSAESNDETSYKELVRIYTALPDYNACYNIALKGADLGYAYCLNTLAYCYALGRGTKVDYKLALKTIDKAIAVASSQDVANYYDSKGEILLMKKSTKEAKQMWEKVQSIDPMFYKRNNSELDNYFKALHN
jgi:TPR repeat protein